MPNPPPRFALKRYSFNSCSGSKNVGNRCYPSSKRLNRVAKSRLTTFNRPGQQTSYSYDANLLSDGARRFDYDSANRLAQVKLQQNGEEAAIGYLHNAQGQRVFKSEPKAQSYQPNETQLGTDFTTWLKKNFGWLFAKAQLSASLGTAYR